MTRHAQRATAHVPCILEQLKEMMSMATKQIDQDEDSIRIYKFCATCANEIISYGIKKGWEEDDVIVK